MINIFPFRCTASYLNNCIYYCTPTNTGVVIVHHHPIGSFLRTQDSEQMKASCWESRAPTSFRIGMRTLSMLHSMMLEQWEILFVYHCLYSHWVSGDKWHSSLRQEPGSQHMTDRTMYWFDPLCSLVWPESEHFTLTPKFSLLPDECFAFNSVSGRKDIMFSTFLHHWDFSLLFTIDCQYFSQGFTIC